MGRSLLSLGSCTWPLAAMMEQSRINVCACAERALRKDFKQEHGVGSRQLWYYLSRGSLSSIRFGVSLWDTPLLRIPRSPITLRQPQLAGRRDVVSGSGVPTLSIKGATQRHYDIQKPLLASHQKPLTNSSTNNWPPRRFSPDSFNFAFQPIERIVRYYDGCSNADCTG